MKKLLIILLIPFFSLGQVKDVSDTLSVGKHTNVLIKSKYVKPILIKLDTLNKDPQYNAEGDTVSRIEKKSKKIPKKIPKKNTTKNQSFFSRIFQFISNLI
jgi:hypothetical protein